MDPVVEVNNLSKKFKETDAVTDLSFTVYDGDIYGFLGQNGAGKSTTIRMLLTLIKPDRGQITIFGKDLQLHRNAIMKQTGAIIERPDMYKYISAYDNLSIFAKLSGVKLSRNNIMDKLEQVGLADRSNGKVKTFSQGMKQRLGIAIALVHDPKLIILDEPTNGLDPQGIADMRNMIIGLSRKMGKTIIVSSHLLSEIELMANRMIIINKGKKIVEGKVSDLLDPKNSMVQLETTDDKATYSALRNTAWADKATLTDKHIQIKLGRNEIPALAEMLHDINAGILAIRPRHSLEDYFLSLTNEQADV